MSVSTQNFRSNRRKYDEEFKKNAVKLSYASPRTVKEVADDLGVSESCYTGGGSVTRLGARKLRPPHWRKN